MWVSILVNTALALAFLATLAYFYLTRNYGYWKSRGVYCPKPEFFFGNIRDTVLRRIANSDFYTNYYNKHKDHKVVGIYRMATPCLMVRDVEILKHIFVKDFDQFVDRGLEFTKEGLGLNLFMADGDSWRVLRSKFSPIFTSSKLKGMMPLINEQADKWITHVAPLLAQQSERPIYPLVQKFTLGSIGSCAFGIDVPFTELDREGNIYSKIDKLIFSNQFATELEFLFPGLLKKLNMSMFPAYLTDFFFGLVKQIMRERGGVNSGRKDFMDLIIDIRKEGSLRGARRDTGEEAATTLQVTDSMVAAQAFVFYAAGYETSASTVSFLLHELAYAPDVQDRLVTEIRQMLTDNNGEYTFEGLHEMKYMGQVLDETLRMYPVVDPLQRCLASKSYKLPGTDVTIEKGTIIVVCARGIHYDPQYWTEPERFDPDRFSEAMKGTQPLCSYLPFGTGPRNCIGMRFAQVQTRLLIARVLSKYRVEPGAATKRRHSFDPSRPLATIATKFPLKLVPRDQ